MNTNGEYILGRTLAETAQKAAATGPATGLQPDEFKKQFIGNYYAGFFMWVNWITAIAQLFLVSRFLKWFGVRVALFVMPLIALGGYGLLATVPVAGDGSAASRSPENSTDSLATEHRAPGAVPAADVARGEVQGQAGDRHVLLADGRRAPRPGSLTHRHADRADHTDLRGDQRRAGRGVWLGIADRGRRASTGS